MRAGRRWFRHGGGMRTLELAEPTGRYLSMAEREEIAILRGQVGIREIARACQVFCVRAGHWRWGLMRSG